MLMKILCAYCKKILGEKEIEGELKYNISHGCCEECKRALLKELATLKQSQSPK